jgi:hydroxyacylglutathione hydrolase
MILIATIRNSILFQQALAVKAPKANAGSFFEYRRGGCTIGHVECWQRAPPSGFHGASMIVKTLPVGELLTNCYVVGCERTQCAVVIDPGGEAQRVLKTVNTLGLTLTRVLLTHAHFDHMAAAHDLVVATGARVSIHPAERTLLDAGGAAMLFGFPSPEAPEQVDDLATGQQIVVGDMHLQVLHTPGHSPGSVCFHEAGQHTVFDGDVLFASGIGRTDLPGGSYDTLMRSIQQLMSLPDNTVVYPGHGPATTIGQERTGNPWF